jgi:hypothetical protein
VKRSRAGREPTDDGKQTLDFGIIIIPSFTFRPEIFRRDPFRDAKNLV